MDDIIYRNRIPGIFAEESQPQTDFSMTRRHIHEGTELYFLFEGNRYYFIEQDTFHVTPCMAILIHPNQMHRTSATENSNGHHRFLLQIESSVLEQFFCLPNAPSKHDFEENYWGVTEFSPENWQQVLAIIEMLKKELASKNSESNGMGLLLVLQLLMLFVRNRRQQLFNTSGNFCPEHTVHNSMYQMIHEIALYLQNHSTEKCHLDELSAHFYISRSKLTRIFKAVTGFTINEYLTVCRIRKAKNLLDETKLSVADISLQTGFGNITYFEKVFKKMTGMTPMQYRKWEH